MEKMHKVEQLETPDQIVEYVSAYDHVTFAELARRMPSLTEDGQRLILGATDNDTFFWIGSERGIRMLGDLMFGKNPRVSIFPASVMTYLIDGQVYETKKWVPVVLRPAHRGVQCGEMLVDPKMADKIKRNLKRRERKHP